MSISLFQKHHIIPQKMFEIFEDFFESIDIPKNKGNLVLLPTKQKLADFLKRSPHLGGPLPSYTEPLRACPIIQVVDDYQSLQAA